MICGFWRRIGALIIDSILLGIVGTVIGALFLDFLCSLMPWGRIVGLGIVLLYYAPLTSTLGGGQTLGKRLLEIRVVGVNGIPISLGRSIIRQSVLFVPLFSNNMILPPAYMKMSVMATLGIFVFGAGGAIAYLYLFNARTRQSLHDLIAGTYVVHASGAGMPARPPVWRGHFVVIGACVVMTCLIATVLGPKLMKLGPLAGIQSTFEKLHESGTFTVQQLTFGKMYMSGGDASSHINVRAVMFDKNQSQQEVAQHIAKIVLDEIPDADNYDVLHVFVSYGFDIGIAKGFWSYQASHPPSVWRLGADNSRYMLHIGGATTGLRTMLKLPPPAGLASTPDKLRPTSQTGAI